MNILEKLIEKSKELGIKIQHDENLFEASWYDKPFDYVFDVYFSAKNEVEYINAFKNIMERIAEVSPDSYSVPEPLRPEVTEYRPFEIFEQAYITGSSKSFNHDKILKCADKMKQVYYTLLNWYRIYSKICFISENQIMFRTNSRTFLEGMSVYMKIMCTDTNETIWMHAKIERIVPPYKTSGFVMIRPYNTDVYNGLIRVNIPCILCILQNKPYDYSERILNRIVFNANDEADEKHLDYYLDIASPDESNSPDKNIILAYIHDIDEYEKKCKKMGNVIAYYVDFDSFKTAKNMLMDEAVKELVFNRHYFMLPDDKGILEFDE